MKKRIHMAEHISNRERERPRRMLALTVASATLFAQVVGVSASAAEPFERNIDDGPYIVEISELEDTEVEQKLVEDSDKEKAGKTAEPSDEEKAGKPAEPSDEEEADKPAEPSDEEKAGKTEEPSDEEEAKKTEEPSDEEETNKPAEPSDEKTVGNFVNDSGETSIKENFKPETDPSNQPTTSEGVSSKHDITFEDGVFKIYYDIGEDVDGDVVIDLSEVIDELNEYYRQVTGNKDGEYTCVPSDSNKFDIEITTSNGHTYRYKDGSFRLETADTSSNEKLTDFRGFDGQKLSAESIGAIAKSVPMQELFGVSSSSKVKLNHVLNMYSYLEKAGYTGETALTDYLLDYYNGKLGSSYENFTDLAKEHPEMVVDMQGGMADDQYPITEEQYNKLLEDYPDYFGKYSTVMKRNNGQVLIQMKWPEEEIASASYELFYKELLSFYFGDKAGQEAFADGSQGKWNDKDMGLKDYMDNTNEVWSRVNDYMKQATTAGLNKDEASKLAISMAFGVDGPWTNNSYQGYKYNWYNSITLEQVDGDVTINKVDSNGNLIKEPATFQLYYYKVETVDDNEEKVTYYYAIDENGDGYFTTDESKAAALITEDGSCKVRYLVPDYQYYLKELKAPDGYELSKEDIMFNIVSKENTTISVCNKIIEVVPNPDPDPNPDPNPEPSPKPDSEPEVTPEPTPNLETEITIEPEPEVPAEETIENIDSPKTPITAPVFNPEVPKTGNASNHTDVVLLLISIAGIGTLAVTKKENKSK